MAEVGVWPRFRWEFARCLIDCNISNANALHWTDFQVELLLDKLKQKGAIRRALFLHSKQPSHSKNMTITKGGKMNCEELDAFLRVSSKLCFRQIISGALSATGSLC